MRSARQLTIAKYRQVRGEFLAEGPQSVREAVAAGMASEVFVASDSLDRRAAELAQADSAGVPVHVVDTVGLAGLTSATTPQGVVAVCHRAPGALAGIVAGAASGQLAVAHQMADPGNCGALIRVADAVGAIGVALSEGSVDPTNPKCVRASAGSLFHLPVVVAGDTLSALGQLRAAGFRLLAADVSEDAVDLFAAERTGVLGGRVAWVFGNEAHGLPDAVLGAVDHVLRIPILGRAESLNVATAAAVCLYAHARTEHLGR